MSDLDEERYREAVEIVSEPQKWDPEVVAGASKWLLSRSAPGSASAPHLEEESPLPTPIPAERPRPPSSGTMYVPVGADPSSAALYFSPEMYPRSTTDAGRAQAMAEADRVGAPLVFLDRQRSEAAPVASPGSVTHLDPMATVMSQTTGDEIAHAVPAAVRGLDPTRGIVSTSAAKAAEALGAGRPGMVAAREREIASQPGMQALGALLSIPATLGLSGGNAVRSTFGAPETAGQMARQALTQGGVAAAAGPVVRAETGRDPRVSGSDLAEGAAPLALGLPLAGLGAVAQRAERALAETPAVRAAARAERAGIPVSNTGDIDPSAVDPEVLRAMRDRADPNGSVSETVAARVAGRPEVGRTLLRLDALSNPIADPAEDTLARLPETVRRARGISVGDVAPEAAEFAGARRSVPQVAASLLSEPGTPFRTSLDEGELRAIEAALPASAVPPEARAAVIEQVRGGRPIAEAAQEMRSNLARLGVPEALRVAQTRIDEEVSRIAGPAASDVRRHFESAGGVPSSATRFAAEEAAVPASAHLSREQVRTIRDAGGLVRGIDEPQSTEGLAANLEALAERYERVPGAEAQAGRIRGLISRMVSEEPGGDALVLTPEDYQLMTQLERKAATSLLHDPAKSGSQDVVAAMVGQRGPELAAANQLSREAFERLNARLAAFDVPERLEGNESQLAELFSGRLEPAMERAANEIPAGEFTPAAISRMRAAIADDPAATAALDRMVATARVAKTEAPEEARALAGLSGPGSLGTLPSAMQRPERSDAAYRALLGAPTADPAQAAVLSRAVPGLVGEQRALSAAGETVSPASRAFGYSPGDAPLVRLEKARETAARYGSGEAAGRGAFEAELGDAATLADLRAAGNVERTEQRAESVLGYRRGASKDVRTERAMAAARKMERVPGAPSKAIERSASRIRAVLGVDAGMAPEAARERLRTAFRDFAMGRQKKRTDMAKVLSEVGLGDEIRRLEQAGSIDELQKALDSATNAAFQALGGFARRAVRGAPIASHRMARDVGAGTRASGVAAGTMLRPGAGGGPDD